MKRLLLFTATIATAVGLSASVATADSCACGQDINYHGMDQCQPYPVQPSPYTWICWNPRDGWHGEIARI